MYHMWKRSPFSLTPLRSHWAGAGAGGKNEDKSLCLLCLLSVIPSCQSRTNTAQDRTPGCTFHILTGWASRPTLGPPSAFLGHWEGKRHNTGPENSCETSWLFHLVMQSSSFEEYGQGPCNRRLIKYICSKVYEQGTHPNFSLQF